MKKHIFSYEKKPIAKAGRESLRICQEIAAKMSKMYKYQLGAEICAAGIDLASSIYLALDEMGFSEQKENRIGNILKAIINLVVLIRVGKDVGQIQQEKFEEIIKTLVSIKSQTENWLLFIQKENNENKQE